MSLASALPILPLVLSAHVAFTPTIPDPVHQARPIEAPEGLHETRKQFLVRTFRRIFQIENPEIDLGNGTSKEAADHLLPYGVMLNRDDPCATDVADRQVERFGRVAGYDSFHWAWYPENKALRNTGYKMYVITRMNLGNLADYLSDGDFLSNIAQELQGDAIYDGYLTGRQIVLNRTECAGFDLYQIELS